MKRIALIFSFLLIISGVLFFWLNTPARYFLESNANLSSGKIARAINILEEASKKYPDNYKINFALAKAYLSSGEIEQANEIILSKNKPKTILKNRSFQNFLVDLSESNYTIGNIKYARLFGAEYLNNHNPNEVSKKIVKNYVRIGEIFPEKSIELWEKAFNIASALGKSELKESLKALLLPKYFQIADNLRSRKMYEDAVSILQKARVLGKSAELDYKEAVIYGDLGEINLAQRQFEEALQLEPENDNYKIAYANFLKNAAFKTGDQTKKNEYSEKVKLLLAGGEDDPRKSGILNKIINLNAKYKIADGGLKVTMVGDYFYPSVTFKIKPVSATTLKKYKIVFLDKDKNQLDTYEAPVTNDELNQLIEVTCRNPVDDANLINAKLFVNDEFVKEYSNK